MRLGYNQGPELAYWWLDRHVDFDAAQTPRVREALQQWFAWHRRDQLPEYSKLLVRAQTEVLSATTPQRVCAWWDEGRSRARVAFEHATPSVAELVLTLTPQQLVNIERRHAKVNAEYRDEHLQADPKRRLKASLKRAVDRAEKLYGSLSTAQEERLAQSLAHSPFDAEREYAQRRRRQQDAVQTVRLLIRDAAGREQARAALAAYAQRMQQSPDEEERRHTEQVVQFNCGLIAALHNSTTAEQRRHAADNLAGWNSDLRFLIGDAGG
jgi:hypothetical protein